MEAVVLRRRRLAGFCVAVGVTKEISKMVCECVMFMYLAKQLRHWGAEVVRTRRLSNFSFISNSGWSMRFWPKLSGVVCSVCLGDTALS
jgi:hypothetical protein